MKKQTYPKGATLQWCPEIRKTHAHYTGTVLTVEDYYDSRGIYALRTQSGNIVFSDEESIEPYGAAPTLHLLDEITLTISKHLYPMIRFVGPSGYEIIAECRCGEEVRDELPELFNHATHVSEEILKIVREHGHK